jgi:hypothetical protein
MLSSDGHTEFLHMKSILAAAQALVARSADADNLRRYFQAMGRNLVSKERMEALVLGVSGTANQNPDIR